MVTDAIFCPQINQIINFKIVDKLAEIQFAHSITILMLKALKAMAKFSWHLSNLVAFIRLNLFVKINLQDWLDKPFEEHIMKLCFI